VKYETAEAFRTALEQRLKNEAEVSRMALIRLRKRVTLERFLARLEVRRTPALDAAAGFHAVRYTVRADLAGRRFEQFPVDVALSESSPIHAEPLFGANSLEFADVAALQLPVVSLEQHVAEKLHATGAAERTRLG